MTTIYFDCYHLTVPETPQTEGCGLQVLREQLAQPPHSLSGNLLVVAPLDAVVGVILETHTLIAAAGGLVFNVEGALLVIRRRGCWDLPKGKLEPGESLEQGALREVEEETGADRLILGKRLADTYHTYYMYGQYVLKQTYWFEMQVHHIPELTAQAEEDITEVRWVQPEEIPAILEQTYPNIRNILETYYGL